MLIYLDTNVFHRPFNDQSQTRIRREALAFARILEFIEQGKVDLLKSEILEFEIRQNPDPDTREKVASFLRLAKRDVRLSDNQVRLAESFEKQCGFKGRDALRIAAAFVGRAAYCVSSDDRMFRHTECCARLTRENGFEVTLVRLEQFIQLIEQEGQAKK